MSSGRRATVAKVSHPPAAEDWGDVMPKLMSRAVLTEFELA